MSEPRVSAKTYMATWAGLLGLTLLTSLLGFIDLGQFSIIVAALIAAMKASLIAAFFMHALYESKLVRVILAGGIIWFLILLTLTLTDYITRGWLPFPGK
jgi:cytochrome c oxidase subunit IV